MRNALIIFLLFALTGCIEPYTTKTKGVDGILVVEGFITNGTTKISLCYSVGLDKYTHNPLQKVNHAKVFVESEDVATSEVAGSSGKGVYLIETGELNADTNYRLVIQLDGEEYRSGFIAPAITPPVEITYKHDVIKNNIDIYVSTQGDDHQPGYYLWSYKEDWEIHALLNSVTDRYYCWKRDSSKFLILGTAEKLSVNSIHEKNIKTFLCTNDRISVLYRIQVTQNVLHKEGYDYFENLQKNTEQTGDIFGAIPSEFMGNIRCVSNPEIPVIGYVDVSTPTMTEQYLTDLYYDSAIRNLQLEMCGNENYIKYCSDCTEMGGRKIKPDNWPNDHQ